MFKLQLKSFLNEPRVSYVFQQVNIVKKQVNTIHSEPRFAFYGFLFLEKTLVLFPSQIMTFSQADEFERSPLTFISTSWFKKSAFSLETGVIVNRKSGPP